MSAEKNAPSTTSALSSSRATTSKREEAQPLKPPRQKKISQPTITTTPPPPDTTIDNVDVDEECGDDNQVSLFVKKRKNLQTNTNEINSYYQLLSLC